MTAKRQYLATLVTLAAGGILGVVAASRTWGTVRFPSSLPDATETTVSGGDLLPLAPAVSLVAMAAVVVVPAVRRIGRRVVGVVLFVLGAVLAVVATMTAADLTGRLESWAVASPGLPNSANDVSAAPLWAFLLIAAGVLVASAGIVIAVRGPAWPSMGARYERPDSRDRPSSDEHGPTDSRQAWDALDRGDDPT